LKPQEKTTAVYFDSFLSPTWEEKGRKATADFVNAPVPYKRFARNDLERLLLPGILEIE